MVNDASLALRGKEDDRRMRGVEEKGLPCWTTAFLLRRGEDLLLASLLCFRLWSPFDN